MANVIHFSRGSKFLLKGTILIIFGVALFSIFSFTYRRYKSADGLKDEQIEDAEKRFMMPYPNTIVGPEHRIDFSGAEKHILGKSTCYTELPRLNFTCLPFYVLVDIEGVNAYILQNFLRRCENIMAYRPPETSFFIQYPNMNGVKENELLMYLRQFLPFSKRIIARGIQDNELIYGDYGKLGPRPYERDPSSDLAVPVLTPQNLLYDMNPDLRIIFMIRNPTIATFVAYCSANYPLDEFEAEVERGISIFNACKNQSGFVPCEFSPDMHDPTTLKVRVVNYIYSFWIRKMTEIFPVDQYKVVLYEDLVQPGSQVETLIDVLNFLTFDDIDPNDLLQKLNNSRGTGPVPTPLKCDISQIPVGAKGKLDEFFEAFNRILYEEFSLGYFRGWSYPEDRR